MGTRWKMANRPQKISKMLVSTSFFLERKLRYVNAVKFDDI